MQAEPEPSTQLQSVQSSIADGFQVQVYLPSVSHACHVSATSTVAGSIVDMHDKMQGYSRHIYADTRFLPEKMDLTEWTLRKASAVASKSQLFL